ncbi:MAG: CopG family transcriptional regulator [Acidimicrobiales bacterium]
MASELATFDYAVVMSVVSIRFSDEPVHERLRESARRHKMAISTLAERLIDEGLRSEAHPLVVFRPAATGRRAVLVGGPEIADVVGAIVGGDVPVDQRRARAAELLAITGAQVDAALAYYAEFTDEIDTLIAERAQQADAAEARWRRQQALLES